MNRQSRAARPKPLEEQFEDRRIWFDQPFVRRDDDAAKFRQERKAPGGDVEFHAREIGDRIERDAGGAQLLQQGDGTLDGAGDHFVPALVIGADLGLIFGKGGDPFGDRLAPRTGRDRDRGSRRCGRHERGTSRPSSHGRKGRDRAASGPNGSGHCRCRRRRSRGNEEPLDLSPPTPRRRLPNATKARKGERSPIARFEALARPAALSPPRVSAAASPCRHCESRPA